MQGGRGLDRRSWRWRRGSFDRTRCSTTRVPRSGSGRRGGPGSLRRGGVDPPAAGAGDLLYEPRGPSDAGTWGEARTAGAETTSRGPGAGGRRRPRSPRGSASRMSGRPGSHRTRKRRRRMQLPGVRRPAALSCRRHGPTSHRSSGPTGLSHRPTTKRSPEAKPAAAMCPPSLIRGFLIFASTRRSTEVFVRCLVALASGQRGPQPGDPLLHRRVRGEQLREPALCARSAD